jgi:hypothetical protein
MPCNVDPATQEILKLAEAADPAGIRTMGVLTKPDLATEKATQEAVLDLIRGKRNVLKLGYFVVKNRSADDNDSTQGDRLAAEHAFFTSPPWSSVSETCGTKNLRVRLSELLSDLTKREFPELRSDVENSLLKCQEDLLAMGMARSDPSTQRLFLVRMASEFQTITHCALNGYWTGHPIFRTHPELKLSTKIMKLNENFSNTFAEKGHGHKMGQGAQLSEDEEELTDDELYMGNLLTKYSELQDFICTEVYRCPRPTEESMLVRVEEVYESSRGPELGTVGQAFTIGD